MNIRGATEADIPALAELHVTTWNATYPHVAVKPTYAIRERQWREAFTTNDDYWCCFVGEAESGQLIGFAKGTLADHPEFVGQLSKIYVLSTYQRQRLGRRLIGHVARHFLSKGVSSMILFADPENPSCRFYEALGAERLLDDAGKFSGAYGWRDLRKLEVVCLAE